MDFRRSQLDDRRRRVLMEEVASPPEDEQGVPAAAARRAPARAYPEAALTERQARISDLAATRPFVLIVLLLAMLTGVAVIENLYIHWQTSPVPGRAAGSAPLPSVHLAAIDLTARGNLATWYSALLLAAGACGGLIIFSIRCHRVDDYRGGYRVWLWTAGALLWASLDAATGIHETIGAVIGLAAGNARLADIGWLTLYLLVFGALAIRLGIETWHAVGSFSTLSLSAVLYLLAAMTSVGWISLPGYLLATVLETTLVMLAHVTLLAGLLLYARHVHLDAAGKLPLRLRTQGPKPKRKPRAKLGVVSDDEKGTDDESKVAARSGAAAGSGNSAASAAKSPAAPSASGARPGPLAGRMAASISQDDDEDDADDGDAASEGGERLSKAERRRLKKLMRQQRRAA